MLRRKPLAPRRNSRRLSFQSLEHRELKAGDLGGLTITDTTISGNTAGVSPTAINDAPHSSQFVIADAVRVERFAGARLPQR